MGLNKSKMKAIDFTYIVFFSFVTIFTIYRLLTNKEKKGKYYYIRTLFLVVLMGYFIYNKIIVF